jgi:hypothetical protein
MRIIIGDYNKYNNSKKSTHSGAVALHPSESDTAVEHDLLSCMKFSNGTVLSHA